MGGLSFNFGKKKLFYKKKCVTILTLFGICLFFISKFYAGRRLFLLWKFFIINYVRKLVSVAFSLMKYLRETWCYTWIINEKLVNETEMLQASSHWCFKCIFEWFVIKIPLRVGLYLLYIQACKTFPMIVFCHVSSILSCRSDVAYFIRNLVFDCCWLEPNKFSPPEWKTPAQSPLLAWFK
jgi:hypothetical protein